MKTSHALLLLALPIVGLTSSCSKEGSGLTIQGTGPVETETRTLNAFERVEVATNAEVTIVQGTQQEVRVEAQRNILDILDTSIRSGKLRIETGSYNLRGHEPIRVYITLPTLTAVRLSSNGTVRSTSAWNANTLSVEDTGSGSVDMSCGQVRDMVTSVTGSGSVTLHGAAQQHKAHLTGSGELQAYDLATTDAEVHATGSGRSYVRVSRELEAKLTGSGSIYYKGSPQVSARTTGSGRVVDAN